MLKKILPICVSMVLLVNLAGIAKPLLQNAENRVVPEAANLLKNPVEPSVRNLKRAVKIYKKACLTCHGTLGKGDGVQAGDLKNKPADFNEAIVKERTDGALFWWISNGGSDMEPFNELLSEEDIWRAVLHIRTLQDNDN